MRNNRSPHITDRSLRLTRGPAIYRGFFALGRLILTSATLILAPLPNLIALGEQRAVGIGGKDGTYYIPYDRTAGQKLWATRVVFGGDSGGFFGGAAFDGRRLFSATAFGDGNVLTQTGLCDPAYRDPSNPNIVDTYIQDPSLHSLAVNTGRILREQNDNESFGATTLGDHVVFAGFIGLSETNIPSVKAYDSATLAPLSVAFEQCRWQPWYGEFRGYPHRPDALLWVRQLFRRDRRRCARIRPS